MVDSTKLTGGGHARQDIVPMARAVSLSNFIEVARFLGLDPFEMLREANISPELLENPENLIAASSIAKLRQISADKSGCQHFSLLLAESRDFASLGPVSLVLQHQPTLSDVLSKMITYRQLFNDFVSYDLSVEGEVALFIFQFLEGLGLRQTVEYSVAIAYRSIVELAPGQWRPESAHFTHCAPIDRRVHDRFFHCPIQFNADFNGFTFATQTLYTSNPSSNVTLGRHAETLLEGYLSQRQASSLAHRTRHSIYLLLPAGRANLQNVAANLDLQPRALQRRLQAENTSFGQLLTATRKDLASRYLLTSSLPATTIAMSVGFASLSTFTRWFAGEFGTPPVEWRRQESQSSARTTREFVAA